MTKRVSGIAVAVLFLLVLVLPFAAPVQVQAATQNYTLYYNVADGKLYKDAGFSSAYPKDATWSGSGSTLTLNGFSFSTTAAIGLSLPAGGTISLAAGSKNTITSTVASGSSYAIFSGENVVVTGEGDLDLSAISPDSLSAAIMAGGTGTSRAKDIIIENGVILNAYSDGGTQSGGCVVALNLTVRKGASVHAVGKGDDEAVGLIGYGNCTLQDNATFTIKIIPGASATLAGTIVIAGASTVPVSVPVTGSADGSTSPLTPVVWGDSGMGWYTYMMESDPSIVARYINIIQGTGGRGTTQDDPQDEPTPQGPAEPEPAAEPTTPDETVWQGALQQLAALGTGRSLTISGAGYDYVPHYIFQHLFANPGQTLTVQTPYGNFVLSKARLVAAGVNPDHNYTYEQLKAMGLLGGGSPQTGDASGLPLWIALGGAALAGLGATVAARQKRRGHTAA